jgi:hypothetical protein
MSTTVVDAGLADSDVKWQLNVFDASPSLFRVFLDSARPEKSLSDQELRAKLSTSAVVAPLIRRTECAKTFHDNLKSLRGAADIEAIRALGPPTLLSIYSDQAILDGADQLLQASPEALHSYLVAYVTALSWYAWLDRETGGKAPYVVSFLAILALFTALFFLFTWLNGLAGAPRLLNNWLWGASPQYVHDSPAAASTIDF